ncbi:MAG: acyltransferase family protein, partial [Acetobacteraceae bacterium]
MRAVEAPPLPARPARRLASIQCLRALAAAVVVLVHMRVFEPKYDPGLVLAPHVLDFGQLGVDLFFVISGFIMTTITVREFGRQGAARRFLAQRFLRIYPIYWVFALAVLAVFLVHPGWVNSQHGRPDIVRSFLLLPQQNLPLLLVAWTLTFEMFFYLVFAVLIGCVRRQVLGWVLIGWAVVTAGANLLLAPNATTPVLDVMASPLILEFLGGCAVALAARSLRGRTAGWVLTIFGIAELLGAVLWLSHLGRGFPPNGWLRVALFGSGSVLVVAGAVRLEEAGVRLFPASLVALGDASYSLYLSHVLVIAAVGRVWERFLAGPSAANHLAGLAGVFAAALVG